MGGERMPPGKSSATASYSSPKPELDHGTPGKQTQVNRFFDQWGAGVVTADPADKAEQTKVGNFLTGEVRDDLKGQIRYRLSVALGNIGLALETLRVEQMIKKPDEYGFFVMLVLGIIESVITSYAGIAIKMLRKQGALKSTAEQLGGAVKAAGDAAKAAKEAEKAAVVLSEVQLNSVVKSSLSKGKTAVAGTAASDSAGAAEKTQATGYLLELKSEMDISFDNLSTSLRGLTDAEMLAAWKALVPQMHSQNMYEHKFRQKLKQYMDSPVSKIGRSHDFEGTRQVEKEVRIVRIIVPGAGVKYAEQDALFDSYLLEHPEKAERSPAYDAQEGALSLQQDATWNVEGKEKRRHETPIKAEEVKLNYVPQDLEDLAQKKQEHVWQKPMETFQLTFESGRPRIIKVAGA